MPSIDPQQADRIAATLRSWGWRLSPIKNAPHRWWVYPPDGGRVFLLAPVVGRDVQALYRNLRRAGAEFDPVRREAAKRAAPATTGRATATRRPSPPVSPAPPAEPRSPVPVPDELPGSALALYVGPHAQQRMAERNITEWEVRAAVAWPEYTRRSRADGNGERETLISTRGDIEVVTDGMQVVTVLDRYHGERDVGDRSPAAPPTAVGGPITNQGVHMSTSDKIREHVRTLTGRFTTAEVVRDLNDPLVSTGLVSVVLGSMVKAGDVSRIDRGVYIPVDKPKIRFVEPRNPAEAAAAAARMAEAIASTVLDDESPVRTAKPSDVAKAKAPLTLAEPLSETVARRKAKAEPAADAAPNVLAFEWADPVDVRESAAGREVRAIVALVLEHLDELKHRAGTWARIATLPGLTTYQRQHRAKAVRDAVPGLTVKINDESMYVRIEA